MSRKFLTPIDMTLNQIKNWLTDILASDPGSPVDGQSWLNSTGNSFKRRRNGNTEVIPGNLTCTAPVTNTGSQDVPVIAISAATSGAAGSMSAVDKAKLDAATNANTASAIVQRDASGDFAAHDITANKVTGLIAPVAGSDATNKQYVDDVAAGIKWKAPVRAATTANITLSGAQTIDGVSVIAGDRVLVKDQSTGSQNGIYVAASGAWSRATDFDASAEVTGGSGTFVSEGTAAGNTGWVLTTDDPITIGSTALVFAQFTGGAGVSAGNGLLQTGSVFDVVGNAGRIVANANDVDLASGIVTPGTYQSVTVDTYGRVTAGSNPANATKFAADIGDNSSTSIAVTHSLGTKDVMVEVYRVASPFDTILCDVERNSTSQVTLKFTVAPTTDEFRVVVIG